MRITENGIEGDNPLYIVSMFANLSTLPSCLLFPFLLPIYYVVLYSVSMNTLSNDTQFLLYRCFPLLSHTLFLLSVVQKEHLKDIQSKYDKLAYLLCKTNLRSTVVFPIKLLFSVYLQNIQVSIPQLDISDKDMIKEFAKRITTEKELEKCILSYIITHISGMNETHYQFYLLFAKAIIEYDSDLFLEIAFPQSQHHYCSTASGIVMILLSFENSKILELTRKKNWIVEMMLHNILCMAGICTNSDMHSICSCGNCVVDKEMEILRSFVYGIREKIVQYIRLLLQDKSKRNDPLLLKVKQFYSEI
jgi:hypothetical protein